MSCEWKRADRSSEADGVTGGRPYAERTSLTRFSTERSSPRTDAAAAGTGAANASARPAARSGRPRRLLLVGQGTTPDSEARRGQGHREEHPETERQAREREGHQP